MSPQDTNDEKGIQIEKVDELNKQIQPQEDELQHKQQANRTQRQINQTQQIIQQDNNGSKLQFQQNKEIQQPIGQKKANQGYVKMKNKKMNRKIAQQDQDDHQAKSQYSNNSMDSTGQQFVGGEQIAVQKPSGGTNAHTNVPSFLVKTYEIVSDPESNNVICWNEEGDGFVVKQVNEFSDKILPNFFKHNNFASFIRQLNMYDFHKTRNMSNQQCFQHSSFIRGNKEFLRNIKRKTSAAEKQRVLVDQILGGQIQSMAGQMYQNKRMRKAIGKLNCPTGMQAPSSSLMLTHQPVIPKYGGRAPLMITQGHNEDQIQDMPITGGHNQHSMVNFQGQDQISQFKNQDCFSNPLQILGKEQQVFNNEGQLDNIGKQNHQSDFRIMNTERANDNYQALHLGDNNLIERQDAEMANQVIQRKQIQRVMQGQNRRIGQLENRLNHIEMLNKKYLQENFELQRENTELQKNKDSQRILERFLMMFLNSVGAGNLADKIGQKFTLMPSTNSKRELQAPELLQGFLEDNVLDESIQILHKQMSSQEKKPQITELMASQNTYDKQQNQTSKNRHLKQDNSRNQISNDTSPLATERDQGSTEQLFKKQYEKQNIPKVNRFNEKNTDKQNINEGSGFSKRSGHSRRSKSEPRSYSRDKIGTENLKQNEMRRMEVREQVDHQKQLSNSSKDKIIMPRNIAENTSLSKIEDINHSDYHLGRGASAYNQVSTQKDNDNIMDEIMSSGRQNSNHLNPNRYYGKPKRMYSNRNDILGHHASISAHSPQNNNGNQFQDMLRLMFEMMSQQQVCNSPRYHNNNIAQMGVSPRASVGYGQFGQSHPRGGLGFTKSTSYGSAQMGQENEYKLNQMVEWFQDQMTNWAKGNKKQQYITFHEDQFYDPERFSKSFPKQTEKRQNNNLNGIHKQRDDEFEEPIGIPSQRSPRKIYKNTNQMNQNLYDQNFDNASQNNSVSMKNDFSSFTDILNRENNKAENIHESESKFVKNHNNINQNEQRNRSFLHDKRAQDNEQSITSHKFQHNQSKRNLEDLSSIHPSPQINRPNDRTYLKQSLENLNDKIQKPTLDPNLNLNKNDFSIASSIPDPIDASQILRRESSYKMNILDCSQTNLGAIMQESQPKFNHHGDSMNLNNSILQMSPHRNNQGNHNDLNSRQRKLDLRSRETSEVDLRNQQQSLQIHFPSSRYPPGFSKVSLQSREIPSRQALYGHKEYRGNEDTISGRHGHQDTYRNQDEHNMQRMAQKQSRDRGHQGQHSNEQSKIYQRSSNNYSVPSENNDSMNRREHESRLLRDFEREVQRKQHYHQDSDAEQFQQYLRNNHRKEQNLQRDTSNNHSQGGGSNLQLSQAFQKFMAQNPNLIRGTVDSNSKFTENHNVEFETISSHSNNNSKFINKSRQHGLVHSRDTNFEGSMAGAQQYQNNRNFAINAQSANEGSRISNSQSMRMRQINQTAPQKTSYNRNECNPNEFSKHESQQSHANLNYRQRRVDPSQYRQRDAQLQQHQDNTSWLKRTFNNNLQSDKNMQTIQQKTNGKFADPELDEQEIDQLMEMQHQRERLQLSTHRHVLEQKDKIDSILNEPDLHKYQSLHQFPVDSELHGPLDSQSQFMGTSNKNQSLFNVSNTNNQNRMNLEREILVQNLKSLKGDLRNSNQNVDLNANRGRQRKSSNSSHRSMEKVD